MFDFQLELLEKLNLVDYPYENFHPLDISLFKDRVGV
jgi:hypothetical protein